MKKKKLYSKRIKGNQRNKREELKSKIEGSNKQQTEF